MKHLEASSAMRAFSMAYLSLAFVFLGIVIWNSDRLLARSEFIQNESMRIWTSSLIDTIAPEHIRPRIRSIQIALSSDFPSPSKIPLAPQGPSTILVEQPLLKINQDNAQATIKIIEISNVIFAGDSLANGYAAGAARALHESKSLIKSVDEGIISTGLVAKSYFDWQQKIEDLCKKHPSAIVFSFGSNDPMDMRSDSTVLRFGTVEWNTAYSERATAIVSTAKACGAKTVWLSLPPMRDLEMQKKAKKLHAAQDKACRLADICVQPFSTLNAHLSETYQERALLAGKERLLRAQDGIHMAPDGYYAVATQALHGLGIVPPAFSASK